MIYITHDSCVACLQHHSQHCSPLTPPPPGIAHLLEHMAFKGTQRIGTKDYAAEATLLDALDGAFYALRDAQATGAPMTDVVRLAREFQQLQVRGGLFVGEMRGGIVGGGGGAHGTFIVYIVYCASVSHSHPHAKILGLPILYSHILGLPILYSHIPTQTHTYPHICTFLYTHMHPHAPVHLPTSPPTNPQPPAPTDRGGCLEHSQ